MQLKTEVFLVEKEILVYIQTKSIGIEDNSIKLKMTPLLKKFANIGDKVYLKHSTFMLPTKIKAKKEDEVLLEFPSLTPEKPLGDRRNVRVLSDPENPVKVRFNEITKEVYDISEVGFSIKCGMEEIDEILKNKEISEVEIYLPNLEEWIKGSARLVNVREFENGDILCGYELFLDTPDEVKVRFYIYERVKEILKGEK
ncbi:hypothetical protein [Aquifex aeolicus]|uniref:Uncharacterized protein aq_820 n=1 Tax=Aquifex aeolicus (strain VF5) TaxID=224324 RepID=Y820_AQUAE|nr:hypothetical protein [Aquifex aeolicus]O67001.1 RecName: Full=Uncharacterized protein aq_820 [Aquifex aeolicus VF5]AAC06969.1 putative protein [Aquifex aeolicus VF5]